MRSRDSSPSAPESPEASRTRVEIVAEIGSGHGGRKDRARDLIAAALDSGADVVKFQHFYAHEIIHENTGLVPLPGGALRLFDRFRELETGPDFMEFCKAQAERLGGKFLCSPFGLQSAAELLSIGETRFKIASPELNHFPLLSFLAPRASQLILSTGVSRLLDIDESIDFILDESFDGCRQHHTVEVTGYSAPDLLLLHCITSYPAPEEEYNISLIPHLSRIFGVASGLSDHSLDPVLAPALAVLAGARMVEKHFTLDRNDGGLDDSIALDPSGFRALAEAVHEASQLNVHAETLPDTDELLRLAGRHSGLSSRDPSRIRSILGDGRKRLAASERANYGRSNRSIHVFRALDAGHVLEEDDLGVLRTEKMLRPGLHPRYLPLLPGRILQRDIPAGEGLVWDDLLPRGSRSSAFNS